MADTALFIGFGQTVRGRESQAVKVFGEAVAYYTGLQERGEIESFEAVLLDPHGGDLGGFFLVRGEQAKISQVRDSDEFAALNTRAGVIVEGFGVVGGVLGERLAAAMARFSAAAAELA